MEKCEYEEIINRMKELEKSELKKTQKDYRLLRKYDIMEICVDEMTVQKLIKKAMFTFSWFYNFVNKGCGQNEHVNILII